MFRKNFSAQVLKANMKRKAYGFEVNKKFCADAEQKVLKRIQHNLFV